jgi:hypothetical protein
METRIEVKKTGEGAYEVRVTEGKSETSHHVTLRDEDYSRGTDPPLFRISSRARIEGIDPCPLRSNRHFPLLSPVRTRNQKAPFRRIGVVSIRFRKSYK